MRGNHVSAAIATVRAGVLLVRRDGRLFYADRPRVPIARYVPPWARQALAVMGYQVIF